MRISPRKSKRIYFTIFIAALIAITIFSIIGFDKFKPVKSTDLSNIAVSTQRDTLKTGKGITSNKSSFHDIIKSYGDNYLKLEDDKH